MLETKRVVVYGKRSSRIVYVSNDNRISQDSPKHRRSRENGTSTSPTALRKVLSRGRKVYGLSTSPRGSPKSGKIFGLTSKRLPDVSIGISPNRKPLEPKNVVPPSPSVVYLGQKTTHTSDAKLTTFAPFVDSDIVILETPKRKVTRRSNKVNKDRSHWPQQAMNEVDDGYEVVRPPRRRAVKKAIIYSENEDKGDEDDGFKLPLSRHGARVNPIVISDDGDDDDSKDLLLPPPDLPKSAGAPRRNLRNPRRLKEPQKPPPATLELEQSFTGLSLGDDPVRLQLSRPLPGLSLKTSPLAPHLAALLAECGQTTPQCFSTFVQTFPSDDLHEDNISVDLTFRKIGEASFSEVFAIGSVVLKIIPLRDESRRVQTNGDMDTPQESDARDVLQEVIVTREMGQTCPGFIKLLRTYVVVGKYPPSLLALWDEFNDAKVSENIRPNVFPSIQAYAVLVLPHGGPDLEACTIPMKGGWRQACSIFWQITRALATAEELVSFEHRDLHWGQILVKSVTPVRHTALRTPRRPAAIGCDNADDVRSITMEHPSHGVTATIIDLGLARMSARNGNASSVHWTPFDDLTFEGEGDYQFDVYRMMRHVHGRGAWDQYCPQTNVMWLHYLTVKLLRSKRLRPPVSRSTAVIIGVFNEKQCYDCLIEMEQLLANCIPQLKGKKYRGGAKGIFSKAGDILYFAKGRGWLQ